MTREERQAAVATCLDQVKLIMGPCKLLLIAIPEKGDTLAMSTGSRDDFAPYVNGDRDPYVVGFEKSRGVTRQ